MVNVDHAMCSVTVNKSAVNKECLTVAKLENAENVSHQIVLKYLGLFWVSLPEIYFIVALYQACSCQTQIYTIKK